MQTAHLDNIGGYIDFDEISNHYRSDSMQSTVGYFKLRFIAKMSERIIFVQLWFKSNVRISGTITFRIICRLSQYILTV